MGIRPSRANTFNASQWLRMYRNASAQSLLGSTWLSGAVSRQSLIPRGTIVDSRSRSAWRSCQVSYTARVSTSYSD
jgi:hypothetical protein